MNTGYTRLSEYNCARKDGAPPDSAPASSGGAAEGDYGAMFTRWVAQMFSCRRTNAPPPTEPDAGDQKVGVPAAILAVLRSVMNSEAVPDKMLDGIGKEQLIDIYQFIYSHRKMLNIPDPYLKVMCDLIQARFKNDEIIIIHPSLHDLLHDRIYRITVRGKMYAVASWHDEMYFDLPGGDLLVVFCIPDLPDAVHIDKYKNVHVKHTTPFSPALLDAGGVVQFDMGGDGTLVNLPCAGLFVKKEQIVPMRRCGIGRMSDADAYETAARGDIFVHLVFGAEA